jgi:voltage-gated potassium channel
MNRGISISDTDKDQSGELKGFGYEIFMGLLSILSIINIVLAILPFVSSNTKAVILIVDNFLTLFFLFDFSYRFFTVKSKSHYFFKNWGWADLLASMPFYGLRILRLFRVVRVIKLSKNYGLHNVASQLSDSRAEFAVYLVILMVILVLEVGASLVLYFEYKSPNANIKTAGDALWWGYVTITTVGYGDFFPVSKGGRLVGAAVMATGISIFSVFTAFIANSFLAPKKKKKEEVALKPEDPKTKLAEVKKLLEEQEKDLKTRIEEIEKML